MSTTKIFPKSAVSQNKVTTIKLDGSMLVQSNANFSTNWTDTVTYGPNIPNWRQLLKLGQNATTGLQVVGNTVTVKRGFLRENRKTNSQSDPSTTKTWLMEGDFGLSQTFGGNPSSLSDTTANNRALGKFVERIREVNTTFQGGVFLGEIAQTIHGIRHPAQGLRKLVDSYRYAARKLRSTEGFRIVREPLEKHLADLWLEHSFHWLPLLHDIDDAAETLSQLKHRHEEQPTSKPIRATGTSETNAQSSIAGHTNGGLQWLRVEDSVDKVTVVYRGAVRVNPRDSALMAPELLGFNPASFLPTVWELMPYSFLIDYFTNIGDIVNGWSTLTSNLMWSNRTVIKETIATRTAHCKAVLWANDASHESFSFSAPEVVCTRRDINRASYSGSFIPSFELEIPGSGSKKWLNIAALVVSRSSDLLFKLL
jgi:hypothetical protein